MWLKIIFIGIASVFVYRLFGGKVPFLDKTVKKTKEDEHDFEKIEATSACAVCGVYVTEDDALIYQKKSYCSAECLKRVK